MDKPGTPSSGAPHATQNLRQQLAQQLTACQGSSGSNLTLTVTTVTPNGNDASMVVVLDTVERLSCELNRIELTAPHTRAMSADDLKSYSDALADRIRYLIEPLATLEVDRELLSAQVRSYPPEREEDRTSRYFEVSLGSTGSLTFCRYEKQPGKKRERISSALTHEVLLRLCQDLANG